jgi:hypothetical protein
VEAGRGVGVGQALRAQASAACGEAVLSISFLGPPKLLALLHPLLCLDSFAILLSGNDLKINS